MTDGQAPQPVVIADYDPSWPIRYEEERGRIIEALGGAIEGVVAIEHVGSTSVPGCGAKPIIDIMIGVRELTHGELCVGPLETLGYEYRGELGIPGRFYFAKPRARRPRSHHIHLVERGSRFWQKHIAFRDLLRNHPDLVDEYGALKRRLAAEFGADRIGYTFAKSPFIEAALAYGHAVTEGEALVIADYDHEWPMYFELEKEAIVGALGDAASEVVAIEHVGSTAVPGLDAKPIIDIAVGVRELATASRLVPSLEAIGYVYEQPQVRDGDLYFFRGAPHTHHVHVVEHGGPHWQGYIVFCELLRTNGDLAERYASAKRELAARYWNDPDRRAYAHAKTHFIEATLAQARHP